MTIHAALNAGEQTPNAAPCSSIRMTRNHVFLLACMTMLLLCAPRVATSDAPMDQDFSLQGQNAPWTLEADQVESLHNEQAFRATGDVLIRQGDNLIRSDQATYYRDTGFAHLKGNVRIEWDGDVMDGESADFDMRNSTGWITDGGIFFTQDHYHIRGKLLEKACDNTYFFKDAHITTCDGAVPAWSVKSSEGEVTTGGYARMWHPRFQLADWPVLYSPYMVFPVKTQRQSGLLIPQITYSSRLGAGLNIPYYWAINEEQDATFYANMMSKRGVMLGAEYRHFTNLDSKGVWQADWLHDRVTALTEYDEDPQFRGDGLVRPNKHRYWVRGKYDGFLGDPLWRTKVDVDFVSDQNYLREFKWGYSGYERIDDQMTRDFGRGMRNIDSLTRRNAIEVSRNWIMLGFRGSLQYDQNLRYWTDNYLSRDDTTLQRLPELNLDLYRTKLGPTPFQLESRNQLAYFWRRAGTTGARMDFAPRLSLPWTTGYGTITPSAMWRQTYYVIDKHDGSWDNVDESEDFFERGIPEFKIEATSSMFGVFDLWNAENLSLTPANVGNSHWSKIRHTFQPELTYTFIPERDQSGNPYFVGDDWIGKRNAISYTLRNTFNRRLDRIVSRDKQQEAGPLETKSLGDDNLLTGLMTENIIAHSDYRDFLIVRFDQAYDFDEATRDTDLERYPRRPFSDIRTDVNLQPGKYIELRNRTWFSPYMSKVTQHDHMLWTSYPGIGAAYFGFDFRAEADDVWRKNQRKREILRVGGLLHLPWGVSIRGDYKTDLDTNEDLEKTFGVGYTHQCYFVELLFSQTPEEDRYEIRFSLKGLEELAGLSF